MTMRREYYWPLMANDVFAVSRDCRSCAASRGTRYKVQKHLKLFPASGRLEFLAMDLLGPLPKTHHGNEFVLVITDRFSKLCRSVPLKNTKAVTVATVFPDLWVYAYGAPAYVLTDNGPQFAAKFFEAVCTMIGIKHVFTTACHPQTNGQVERFNKTLTARLRHYVAEHQRDWDDFVQPLTYAYNMQVHRSTGTTPFDLVLSRHPGGIVTGPAPSTEDAPGGNVSTAAVKRDTLIRLRSAIAHAKVNLTKAQARYKADFDKRVRTLMNVKPGQKVFIDKPKDYQQKHKDHSGEDTATKKLSYRTIGPYVVVRADDSTVTVEIDGLQSTVSIDRITLDPLGSINDASATTGTDGESSGATNDNLGGNDAEGTTLEGDEYVVERIVDHADTSEGRKYRVRWYGYTAADDTWEVAKQIPPNFISRYWKMKEKRKTRRGSKPRI